MTQPNFEALPDLRALRTTFLGKRLAYALSYEYRLLCTGSFASEISKVRYRFRARDPRDAKTGRDPRNKPVEKEDRVIFENGSQFEDVIIFTDDDTIAFKDAIVFHVFGDSRVPGLDNLGRDVPVGFHICGVNESMVLRTSEVSSGSIEALTGTIEGRMVLRAPNRTDQMDNEPVRISVTYDGALQLAEPLNVGKADSDVRHSLQGSAFITPFFETKHPKYHWLTEQACIAFGTWKLDKKGLAIASFDVYCAE